MKKPDLVHETNCEGLKCRFDLYRANDFAELENVTQVYCFVLDDKDRVLIVSRDGEYWQLPGGGVEKGESLEETAYREVYEESAVIIDRASLQPFFYQSAYLEEEGKWKLDGNQVRFLARAKRKDKFIDDPDMEDIKFQKWVDVNQLDKYVKWGKSIKWVQEQIINSQIVDS